MSVRTPRAGTQRATVILVSVLLATAAAGCASHGNQASTAPSSPPDSPPPPSVPPTLTSAPPPTWPPRGTATPSDLPPTLHLSDADGTKTYVVAVGTMIDVTVQLRPGEGVSISPPSSATETILQTVSVDRAAAITTHGVFKAVAPGDSAIIVTENAPPQPCPAGAHSPCAAPAPFGFDFFITVMAAKS